MSAGNGWDKPEVLAAKMTELASGVRILSKQIEEMGAWTRSHEQSEFGYHGRVEEHMALTREYIAGSRAAEKTIDTRLNLVEAADTLMREAISRVDRDHSLEIRELESSLQDQLNRIQSRISWMMGGLGVVLLVILPLAGWALFSIHQLEVQVKTNTARIERDAGGK